MPEPGTCKGPTWKHQLRCRWEVGRGRDPWVFLGMQLNPTLNRYWCLHTAIGYNTRPKNHLTKCIFYKDFFYTVCFYVIFCASFSPCSLHPLWQPGKSATSLGFQAASSGGRNIGVVRLAKKSSTWWRGALGDDVTSLEGTSHQEGGPLNEGLERFGSDDFPIFKGGNDFQVP